MESKTNIIAIILIQTKIPMTIMVWRDGIQHYLVNESRTKQYYKERFTKEKLECLVKTIVITIESESYPEMSSKKTSVGKQ